MPQYIIKDSYGNQITSFNEEGDQSVLRKDAHIPALAIFANIPNAHSLWLDLSDVAGEGYIAGVYDRGDA